MSSAIKLSRANSNISTARIVKNLAVSNNVAYKATNSDQLASNITRLAGDIVKMDPTEQLLIALRRANVLNSKEMVDLQVRHLNESKINRVKKKNVRPVR